MRKPPKGTKRAGYELQGKFPDERHWRSVGKYDTKAIALHHLAIKREDAIGNHAAKYNKDRNIYRIIPLFTWIDRKVSGS